ncbi:unnamed protein product [Albugo candida]|nr:unnamed protein product [Albugo candida]|eukprot:CCI44497.1 unnamed protein product [Albugo candida]
MIQFRENSLLLLEKAKLGQPMELHKPTYAIRGVKEIGNAQMIHATAYWSNQVEWKGISSSTTIQKELEDRTALCPQLRPCETAKCRRPFCLSNINECQIILDRLNHFEYRSTDAFFQDLEHLFSTLNLKKAETRQFMRFFNKMQADRQESLHRDEENSYQLAPIRGDGASKKARPDGDATESNLNFGWKQEQAQDVSDLEILRDAEAYCSIQTLRNEPDASWLNTTDSEKDTQNRSLDRSEGKTARKEIYDRVVILRLRRLIQLHVCPHLNGQEVCVLPTRYVGRDPSHPILQSCVPTGRIQYEHIYSYTSKKLVKYAEFVLEQLHRQAVACKHIYLSHLQQSIDQHLAVCDYIPAKIRSNLSISYKHSAKEYLAYVDAKEQDVEFSSRSNC